MPRRCFLRGIDIFIGISFGQTYFEQSFRSLPTEGAKSYAERKKTRKDVKRRKPFGKRILSRFFHSSDRRRKKLRREEENGKRCQKTEAKKFTALLRKQ